MLRNLAARARYWRQIVWGPLGKSLSVAYTLLAAATWIRDEFVKAPPGQPHLHIVDFLPTWSLSQWSALAFFILVVVMAEGSYRHHQKFVAETDATIESLHKDAADAAVTIEQLRKQAESPKRTPEQQHHYDNTKAILENHGRGLQTALRHLLDHEKLIMNARIPTPVPPEMNLQEMNEWLNQGCATGLARKISTENRETGFEIVPAKVQALKELLFKAD